MEKRILAFIKLGDFLRKFLAGDKTEASQKLDELVDKCFHYNGWFTRENVLRALHGISIMLEEKPLRQFAKKVKEPVHPQTVAVIMAGNIPVVGFHDLLCVLLSGHKILIKLSSEDHVLIPFITGILTGLEPSFTDNIKYAEGKLENFKAVIATGSNNSARYFESYFGKYPNIIRKNRTSVAVLAGDESKEELELLGHDIFDYFGLGCRNVTKVFVPAGYKPDTLYEALFSYKYVLDNKKYANNYEYNRAIYLLNKEPFFDNNFLLIKYSSQIHSPVGVLFWEEYANEEDLLGKTTYVRDELQCLVTNRQGLANSIAIGQSQCPDIFTFADNTDTVAFLNNLA